MSPDCSFVRLPRLGADCAWFALRAALPFLVNTQRFLFPIVPIFVAFMVSLVANWNVSRWVLTIYFGTND